MIFLGDMMQLWIVGQSFFIHLCGGVVGRRPCKVILAGIFKLQVYVVFVQLLDVIFPWCGKDGQDVLTEVVNFGCFSWRGGCCLVNVIIFDVVVFVIFL